MHKMIILGLEELKQAESALKQSFPESIKVLILGRVTYQITTAFIFSSWVIFTCFPGLWLYIQHKQREASQSGGYCGPVARFHCHYLQTQSSGNIILQIQTFMICLKNESCFNSNRSLTVVFVVN